MKKNRTENRYLLFWKSRLFVIILLFVVGFLAVSVTQESLRRLQTRYEIEKLEADVARLQQRNGEMKDVLALLSSSTTQDKQARVTLGKQLSGEHAVFFPDSKTETEIILPDSDTIQYIPIDSYQSNPEKWKTYFTNKFNTP